MLRLPGDTGRLSAVVSLAGSEVGEAEAEFFSSESRRVWPLAAPR